VKERTPLRSWKPPLEFTAEKKRIENGPCTWQKKGKCDWKEYCNMDHSAATMATLPPPGQPRPTPRSVRHASVVSTKNDEKDAPITVMLQRLALLEGKLPLMFRVTFPTAGVREASIPTVNTVRASQMIPRPTSYLAAVKSHLSRTEVCMVEATERQTESTRIPGSAAQASGDDQN
jgi:hypothetical protein